MNESQPGWMRPGTDRQIEFIPDDAIWLVRSGKVNPLLAGE